MGLGQNFDHFSIEQVADPYHLWKALRDKEPIAKSELYGGFYVISRYEDVRRAAQDTAIFSSAEGAAIPSESMPNMVPIDIDPPDHHDYRNIINPAFTPDAVARHEPMIRAIAIDLIDRLSGRHEFDVVAELARDFPPLVTLGFLGFPSETHDLMTRAVNDLTHLRGNDQDDRMAEAGAQMLQTITSLIESRRDGEPHSSERDDLLSTVLHASFQGRPLTDWEVIQMMVNLLFGAVETTATSLAGSLLYLATNPDAQRRLRDQHPIPNAALEELIRWVSPIQCLGRTVRQDTEVGGCPLHKGDRVLLHWASANQDERVFTHPELVDLDRRPNRHVAFGFGPHHCVGSHLGRLMLGVGLEEFLSRIDPFTLGDHDDIEWSGGEARSLRRLPLRVP